MFRVHSYDRENLGYCIFQILPDFSHRPIPGEKVDVRR
jgi:hypothetical protein